MAESSHSTQLRIAPDHPSLPGHFPGQPVVPGVLLLDCVITAAEAWLGHALSVRSLPQVKFISPLLPEQEAVLKLTCETAGKDGNPRQLRFVIQRGEDVVAQGLLVVGLGHPISRSVIPAQAG